MVFKLMEGFTKHHRTFHPTNFKYKNNTEAKNDNENAEILNTHFNSLFNSQVQVNFAVLNNLPQCETRHELGEKLTSTEVKKAINSMPYDKSPGQSGLSTDIIKNLPPRAFNHFVKLIQDFWTEPDTDFASWHVTLLKVLYTGKGDPQDPNNNRGIALKETSAKVLSIIIATTRLLKRLKELNPASRLGT